MEHLQKSYQAIKWCADGDTNRVAVRWLSRTANFRHSLQAEQWRQVSQQQFAVTHRSSLTIHQGITFATWTMLVKVWIMTARHRCTAADRYPFWNWNRMWW